MKFFFVDIVNIVYTYYFPVNKCRPCCTVLCLCDIHVNIVNILPLVLEACNYHSLEWHLHPSNHRGTILCSPESQLNKSEMENEQWLNATFEMAFHKVYSWLTVYIFLTEILQAIQQCLRECYRNMSEYAAPII